MHERFGDLKLDLGMCVENITTNFTPINPMVRISLIGVKFGPWLVVLHRSNQ